MNQKFTIFKIFYPRYYLDLTSRLPRHNLDTGWGLKKFTIFKIFEAHWLLFSSDHVFEHDGIGLHLIASDDRHERDLLGIRVRHLFLHLGWFGIDLDGYTISS